MEVLRAKSALRITDKKDYEQSKILTFILCSLKVEAREIHQGVKNEHIAIRRSDRCSDPIDMYDIIEFIFDTNNNHHKVTNV